MKVDVRDSTSLLVGSGVNNGLMLNNNNALPSNSRISTLENMPRISSCTYSPFP